MSQDTREDLEKYKKMYVETFKQLTKTIRELQDLQIKCEEMFIQTDNIYKL